MAGNAQRREERRRQWRQLWGLLRPHRGRVALIGVSSFGAGAVEATLLVVITRVGLAVADGERSFGVIAGREWRLSAAIACAGALVVVRLVLALFAMRLTISLTTRVGVSARREIADAYLRASWAAQQSESGGRLQELMSSYAGSAATAANSFALAINSALSLTALVLGSLFLNPIATLVVLVVLVVLASALAPLRHRIRARSRAASNAQMEFAASIAELGALGMEMQAYGVRRQFTKRLDGLISLQSNWRAKAMIAQGMLSPLYTALAYAALVLGLALAAALDAGELGGAAAVMLVMLRSLSYGQALQTASGTLAGLGPFIERLDDTVAHYRAHPAEVGSASISDVAAIRAEHVSFEYVADCPVLHGFDFSIEPGEIIGVVGPSGGGKSTLVQLLLGLRNPSDGRITVGGRDLRDVDRASWTGLTAYVAQDANLLSGTIAENVAFFRPIGLEHVKRAAASANILHDIEAMPDGFDTVVGVRGSRLSGGQRQRLSIARALAGDPQVMILDEPTSALDVKSEQLIRETIMGVKGEVTVVIIAHRLSTLDSCDRIMVIEEGRLKAMAEPTELERNNEFFRHTLELSGLRP